MVVVDIAVVVVSVIVAIVQDVVLVLVCDVVFDVVVVVVIVNASAIFDIVCVNVIAVNTHIPPRKKIRVGMAQGFRPTYKRAIITLKEGDSINYNITNVTTN